MHASHVILQILKPFVLVQAVEVRTLKATNFTVRYHVSFEMISIVKSFLTNFAGKLSHVLWLVNLPVTLQADAVLEVSATNLALHVLRGMADEMRSKV